MNTTRPCPVPGCSGVVKPGRLLCLACWRLVPIKLQSAVYSTWRALRRATAGTRDRRAFRIPDYRRACQAAIDAVVRERGIAAPTGAPAPRAAP